MEPSSLEVINNGYLMATWSWCNNNAIHTDAARVGSASWKQLSPSDRYKATKYVWAESEGFPVHDILEPHTEWIQQLRAGYLEVQATKHAIAHECKIFREAMRDAENDDEKELVKAGKRVVIGKCVALYWKKLVEFTYWLGNCLHEHYEDNWNERPLATLRSNKKTTTFCQSRKGFQKTFSIAPICDIRRQCIILSTTVLKDLKKLFGIPPVFDESPLDYIFRDLQKLRSKDKGWKLQGTVRTDGVSLCVIFERKKRDAPKAAVRTQVPERIVAIDPGTINMYFGVEKDANGNYKTYKYRTKQYYHDGFVWASRNRMDAAKRECDDVLERLSQCLKKTVVLTRQLEYWRTYVDNWKRLFACLATRMRSKLSMNVYIKGNQSIDKFLMSLKGSSRKDSVLIAFGAAKFSSTIRGTLSCPTSRAYKRCAAIFKTLLVDEYNTSKYCPRCSEARLLTAPKEARMCRDGIRRMFDSRSVKRCSSPECSRAAAEHPSERIRNIARDENAYEMSRDKVGALNILKCAMAELTGLARPVAIHVFQR
jgi:hypothetical protein